MILEVRKVLVNRLALEIKEELSKAVNIDRKFYIALKYSECGVSKGVFIEECDKDQQYFKRAARLILAWKKEFENTTKAIRHKPTNFSIEFSKESTDKFSAPYVKAFLFDTNGKQIFHCLDEDIYDS